MAQMKCCWEPRCFPQVRQVCRVTFGKAVFPLLEEAPSCCGGRGADKGLHFLQPGYLGRPGRWNLTSEDPLARSASTPPRLLLPKNLDLTA